MDLHQLEYVVEIAKHNNITKAAEALHISQPTLSIFLGRLEKQLGFLLFNRNNNVLTITEKGARYVDTCNKILVLRNELYDSLYYNKKDSIHVGILSSNTRLFSQVFLDYKPLYPDLTIRPVIDHSDRLYKAVVRGDLDFAYITSYLPDIEKLYPNVFYQVVAEYELTVMISKDNPHYRKLHLEQGCLCMDSICELNQMDMSLAVNVPMIKSRIYDSLMPELGIHPKWLITSYELEFMMASLYMNNIFSILPFSYLDDPSIAQILLPGHPRIYKLLIHQKRKHMDAEEKEFIRMANEAFQRNPYYYYL